MQLDAFVDARRPDWDALAVLTKRAGSRPERLGADGILELGALYRAAAADLALARHRYPHDALVPFLEELVSRARHLVYDAGRRRETILQFVTTGYWRRVADRRMLVAIAAAVLVGTAMLGWVWAHDDPGAAAGLVPGALDGVTQPRTETDLGLTLDQQASFASSIFTNNIRVTFLAFAAGIFAGVGTVVVLAYNGAMVGVLVGLAVDAGNGGPFTELVVPHGVLEMSCIVVAAAAGLRLGDSIVHPGRRTRTESIATEAREAVLVVVGTAPWLILAGLVEGFVTPRGVGVGNAVVIGLGLAAVYWALLVWRGKHPAPTPELAPSGAGTPTHSAR